MKTIYDHNGYTLVELMVVMAIFIVIIIISTDAYVRIVIQSSQLTKTSETNIEGIVGLEVLRRDLESAGYGLPWDFMNTIDYNEAEVTLEYLVQGINSNAFNDSPHGVPRAILSAASNPTNKIIDGISGVQLTNPGSNYLVIKSANVAFDNTSKKWSYVNYSSHGTTNKSYVHQWDNTIENFTANDYIITLVNTFSDDAITRQLAMKSSSEFSYKYSGTLPNIPLDEKYMPLSRTIRPTDNVSITNDLYIVYGIKNISGTDTIRMPFNRADYYVKRPAKTPKFCNKGAGVLYKGVVINTLSSDPNSSGGGYTQYPLLYCVGYMQVQYELDRSGNENAGLITNTDSLIDDDGNPLTAQAIREQLRTVKVYILAHEGKKDSNYFYPHPDNNKVIVVGDRNLTSIGKVFKKTDMENTFGADWFNYRWKVYTIAVKPKNLNR